MEVDMMAMLVLMGIVLAAVKALVVGYGAALGVRLALRGVKLPRMK